MVTKYAKKTGSHLSVIVQQQQAKILFEKRFILHFYYPTKEQYL